MEITEDRHPTEERAGLFAARNANDAVSAGTIERWYQPRPEIRLEDLAGMKALKEQLRMAADFPEEGNCPAKACLLYGPPGTGKTSLTVAFAGSLMDRGFEFLSLTSEEIRSKQVGEAERTLTAAFNEAMDAAAESSGCILRIEEAETVCADRSNSRMTDFARRLTDTFLENLAVLLRSDRRVILLCTSSLPWEADPALLDRVRLIRVPLPDPDAREKYLRSRIPAGLHLTPGLTFRRLAEETENCNYPELNWLSNNVLFQLRQRLMQDERNRVLDEKGEWDWNAAQEKIVQRLENGGAAISLELFREEMKQLDIPRDKSKILAMFRAFEESRTVG